MKNRHAIVFRSILVLFVWILHLKTRPWVLPFFGQHFLPVSSRTKPAYVTKHQIRHEPSIFCFVLRSKERTSMALTEEVKFETKMCFFCVNIDRTTEARCRRDFLHIFYGVSPAGVFATSPFPHQYHKPIGMSFLLVLRSSSPPSLASRMKYSHTDWVHVGTLKWLQRSFFRNPL